MLDKCMLNMSSSYNKDILLLLLLLLLCSIISNAISLIHILTTTYQKL